MPWDVKKKDDKWCVYKKGSSSPIKGGCHGSEAEAKKHQRALYASEATSASSMHIVHVFSEQDKAKIRAGEPIWIHAAPYGDTSHPIYGDVALDDLKFQRFVENFEANVVGHDLPITFEHFGIDAAKGYKAAGWITGVDIREDTGLWYQVNFTEEGATEVNDGAWRYFSFEFDDLYEDSDNNLFLDVLRGGALTNNPYWGNMQPLNFSSLILDHPEIVDESKEIEHSEPGSGGGGEPIPKEQESDQNTERKQRIDTPPHILEEEGSMEEFLKKLAAEWGMKEDATEEDVIAEAKSRNSFSSIAEALGIEEVDEKSVLSAIKDLTEEVQPLRDAEDEADKRRSFREAFPDEYEEHQRLISESRENKAKAFSGSYARFSRKRKNAEGDEVVEKSTTGFSARTLEEIEKLHLAFSNKAATPEQFKSVLDSIADVGLVDYGEKGSGLAPDTEEYADPSRAFSAKVAHYMENDELDRRAAVAMVRKEHPEIWDAYRNPPQMAPTPNS